MLNSPILAFVLASAAAAQGAADGAFPPHRVVGNVYYVGSKNLAVYLITTPKGHFLINSGFARTVPLIAASVKSLGFKMRDVKILLASHAHSDHVAGHARLQRLTGAKVYVMKGDDTVIAGGGKGQYLYTKSRWEACKVDRVLKDGDKVTLAGVTLIARHTPGHTRGCTTWTARVREKGKTFDVVIVGSPNVNPGFQLVDNKQYPQIAVDFATTFKSLKKLRCDFFLGAHGNYYGMLAKYDRFKRGAKTNPFIDPAGYREYILQKEKAYLATLAKQKAAKKSSSNVASKPAAPRPLRIAKPVNGHIHPAICRSRKGTLVVIYGRVNHVDLRVTRSSDGGKSWTTPKPFVHTVKRTYYPGSLTAMANGQILHMWNRWSTETNQKEPRSVLYSLSDDQGITWSKPKPLPRDPKVRSIIRHPVVELTTNKWLISLSDKTIVFNPTSGTGKPFGDGRVHGLIPVVRTPKGTFVSGAGLRSTDNGNTWTEINGFPNLKSQGWRHEMVCLANGWLLASQILGPGFGGERIRYAISRDDGISWTGIFEYYNPGRAIVGRACPRTVQLDAKTIGVVFYDISKRQPGGPGLFFLRIPLAKLGR